MLNNLILVGRIVEEIKGEEENIRKGAILTIATPRTSKNAEGVYETDFFNCRVFDSQAETVKEYCQKGDTIGIKGRLQTRVVEKENGEKEYKIEVVAEKVTFLSSKKD